jgi:esterase
VLSFKRIAAPGARPTRRVAFLHGILGRGQNWRSVAKALVEARPDVEAVLVDLRAHGDSRHVPPPDDLESAADDVAQLLRDEPVETLLGHSFGGKVALKVAEQPPAALKRLVVIDSNPGARPARRGSEGTMKVVDMLEALPPSFPNRRAFIEHVVAQGHRPALARWLAMNLERTKGGGVAFGLDASRIRDLLDGYFEEDLWSVLEAPPARLEQVDLIIGGRSTVLDEGDRERAREAGPATLVHLLPEADHWVHVDDPAGLQRVLLKSVPE